jgi:predicted AlkP superfamily pyrophosphatase or phosphodiesterase
MFILLNCLLVGCGEKPPEGAALVQSTGVENLQPKKNVIVIIIDSMTEAVINDGLKRGSLPALSFLIEKGTVYHDLVAPFPSMSVPIETTLITGTSPREHKIPGLVWYDPAADTIVDYGSTISKYWKLGFDDTIMNTLVHLNTNHISSNVETIHETLNKKGLTSGSINLLVYRGNKTHAVNVPNYIQTLLHLPKDMKTKGPDLLAFGQAVQPKVVQSANVDDAVYQRFGLNDSFSAEVVTKLIQEKQQPNFLISFFPDYDKDAHKHGPISPEHFGETDGYLQQILNAYESWDKALEENIFIIMGDHGQDALKADKKEVSIELEPILEPLTIASLLDEPSSGDVVVANNHRSVFLYPITDTIGFEDIANHLHQDSRIDHIAWLDNEKLIISKVGIDGVLTVKADGFLEDKYGQSWSIKGNEQIADIELNENGTIHYGDYPDIFNQLYGALYSHSPTMIVTASPGHTFKTEGAPVHDEGGEHGGLHKNDTLASIVIAGTDKELDDHRIKALKEFFLDLLAE